MALAIKRTPCLALKMMQPQLVSRSFSKSCTMWKFSVPKGSFSSKHNFRKPISTCLMSSIFTVAYMKENSLSSQIHRVQIIPKPLSQHYISYLHYVLLKLSSKLFDFWDSVISLIKLSLRLFMLSLTFGPLCFSYPICCQFPLTMNIWLKVLLIAVKYSGPTFVKLGQWASTRRDLFSSDFCDVLGLLHCNAACHPWSHSRHVLRKAFGKHWDTWCNIEFEHPIHSGCIGQVYKGWIDKNILAKEMGTHFENHPGNEESCNGKVEVAVKIIHPGVTELVHLDLTIMRGVANLISSLPGVKWLSLPEIVSEFEELMMKQIDLTVEAKNLDSFNKFFAETSEVKFPSPVWPLVHPDVLIETFEAGIPISHFIGDIRGETITNKQKENLARMGVTAILKMVFVDNFVHADLHPGNIIVQFVPEGHSSSRTDAGQPSTPEIMRLVFLDAGIVASLKEYDLQNLHQVFTAIILNKGDVVGELFMKHATCNECHTPEEFKTEMADLVNDVHQQTLKLGKIQVAGLLSNLFNLLMNHKVKLESNFSSVLLAIMILEGLGRSLDPQLDIMQQARPVLLSRLYGPTR